MTIDLPKGFKTHSIPAGADTTGRYRPGDKKRRRSSEEAQHRLQIAKRAAMTPEERAIADDFAEAVDEAHFQRRRDQDTMSMDQAQANYDRALNRLREERDSKLAALPSEKRSDGKYDVNTFDFEAHQRAQREEWEAKVNAMFPPAKSKGDSNDASRS